MWRGSDPRQASLKLLILASWWNVYFYFLFFLSCWMINWKSVQCTQQTMGFLCLDISTFVAIKSRIIRIRNPDVFHENEFCILKREAAPGEARTHGLQIMRLTRCLLRYRGFSGDAVKIWDNYESLTQSAPLSFTCYEFISIEKYLIKMSTHGGTRTPNLRFRRPTPYPLGHAGIGTGGAQRKNVHK